MTAIGTRKLEIVTFYEKPRNLERSIQEIVRSARGTMKVLAVPDRVPTPAKYLTVIQNISSIKEMWKRHIEIERALFPKVPGFDMHSDIALFRIIEENEAIEKQLACFLEAPWPRSTQAGLLAIRIPVSEVLGRLLTQIELEGAFSEGTTYRRLVR